MKGYFVNQNLISVLNHKDFFVMQIKSFYNSFCKEIKLLRFQIIMSYLKDFLFSDKKLLSKIIFPLIYIGTLTNCHSEGCKDLNEKSCPVLKDFTVFDQTHPLHFNHLCSEVGHQFSASWQSYAFFENAPSNKNWKALILAEVAVGWIRGPVGPNGINIQLEKFQIESFSDWAENSLTLALQVTDRRTGETVTGNEAKTFSSSYRGRAEEKNFTLDSEGHFNWEQFTEPEERNSTDKNIYNHPEDIQVISKNISHPENSQAFAIVLKNSETQDQMTLKGPVLTDLKTRLDIENPQPQTLGFWQTMSPFQRGGLWHFLGAGYRYRDCIYLRKKAKKEFEIRFSKN